MKVANLFFAVILIFLLYLLWIMMRPFLGAVIFAAIIAGSVYPLFLRMLEKTRLNRAAVAAMMCALVVVTVFLPMTWLLFELSKEVVNVYQNLTTTVNNETINDFLFGEGYFARLVEKTSVLLGLDYSLETFKQAVIGYIRGFSGLALKVVNGMVGDLIAFLANFVVMILVIYAFLSEGPELKNFLMELSPLPSDQEELILQKFNQMNFVTLICNGLGGIIQGGLAGIGFWLAGVQSVLFWTTIMAILAFIPLVGISIVYLPVCGFLLLTGQTVSALILFVYCSAVAFITENWFKPMFIGNRIQINSLLVLFCIIGGMNAFGIGGIFYGPLIATLFLTAVELYYKYYWWQHESHDQRDA